VIPLLEIWGQMTGWSENSDFEPIFAGSTSAITPNEKSSVNTNKKFTTHFPMSLRWTSYIPPKPAKGAHKRKTAIFRVKSHFAWRKSATVSLCENSQWQSCKEFIGLSVHTKMIGGGRSLIRENLADLAHCSLTCLQNADFQSIFARSTWSVTPSEKFS